MQKPGFDFHPNQSKSIEFMAFTAFYLTFSIGREGALIKTNRYHLLETDNDIDKKVSVGR